MEKYHIKPNAKVRLSDYDPNALGDFEGEKRECKKKFKQLCVQLGSLQKKLYAEHKHKILIVFQALDTGGKDGTIRAVFKKVNPQGVKVANFKVPTPIELDHDYLWRVHTKVPGKGEMVIFNRSHYEDVLVVRVHKLVPHEVWSKRYRHINEFEQILTEEGTTILKFFLHIDLEEQKKRFLERLEDPQKNWKFNPKDIEERKLWGKYKEAYEEMLCRTSTDWAPWFVVPANRNWIRNLIVASIIVNTLNKLDMHFPNLIENPEPYKAALESD
ncbi:MAG TPA: polyphosphate kinase 2 family protein [Anaerolineae bacterium]|nr:polyphosphate kinase 2 family protein [Anaerolineae bacterium]